MTKSPKTEAEAETATLDEKSKAMAEAHVAAGDGGPDHKDQPDLSGTSEMSDDAGADAQAAADAQAVADAPALDVVTLSYLERNITQLNITGHRLGLVDELRDLYGLIISGNENLGAVTVAMHGIETDPAESLEVALTNWGNAARRAIARVVA